MMKEAPGSSETSVLTRATRRNNPEDTILHSHRRENLKSYLPPVLTYITSVASSIPNVVIGLLSWSNPSSRTMVLGSTQHRTEMSTRNLPRDKERPADKQDWHLTTSPPTVSRLSRSSTCHNPTGFHEPLPFCLNKINTRSVTPDLYLEVPGQLERCS
jgi:hypothetical protein